MDDAKKLVDMLRKGAEMVAMHGVINPELVENAADAIERLAAEVERRRTKTYPMTEIAAILNRHEHRKTKSWVVYTLAEADYFASTPVGFPVFANDDGDIIETWEGNLIANAYLDKEHETRLREKEADHG